MIVTLLLHHTRYELWFGYDNGDARMTHHQRHHDRYLKEYNRIISKQWINLLAYGYKLHGDISLVLLYDKTSCTVNCKVKAPC
jgi:hypothetical protein